MRFPLMAELRRLSISMVITKENWEDGNPNISLNLQQNTRFQPGKHTLRFRVLEPGIVLEKILINTGGLQPSYLGAPESEISGK
jgi:hypothetical protein